jgi:chloramphenicol 3-O phosphotransferase
MSNKNNQPIVIFLNGTSSAGKTSLIQHLQDAFPTPFIHIGIDHFLVMLPLRYVMEGEEAHLGFHFISKENTEHPEREIIKGQYAHSLNHVMRSTMKNFLAQNLSLIIDEVLFADEDYHAYLELFKDYKVYFIAIKPPVDIASQREQMRGDRLLGLARGLYNQVYDNKHYDLKIDTSCLLPNEAAACIIDFIQKNSNLEERL